MTFLFVILVISILLASYRFLVFFQNPVPLGYDPGLYKILFDDYIGNLPNIQFDNLTQWNLQTYPPFLGFFGDIVHIIGYSVPFILTYGIGILSVITIIYIYLFARNSQGKIVAIIAMIIFCISIPQYHSYWLNYYKQILGIIFMLTAFFTLGKKKYLLSIAILIALFTLHRPSGVYFLATYSLYIMIQYLQFRKYDVKNIIVIGVAGLVALVIYMPFYDTLILPLIKPLTTTVMNEGRSGTYFLTEAFGWFNMLIILPSLYGLYLKLTRREFDLVTCAYIVGMIWVGFRLFFYNRMFIFFDIFIIIIASYGFYEIYVKNKNIFYVLFSIFFIAQSLFYLGYIKNLGNPLISKNEFEFIQEIPTMIPENSILMVTDSYYSPWISGYVTPEIVAPGLFHLDVWSLAEWQTWWKTTGPERCNMLKKSFSQRTMPDYLYMGGRQYKIDMSDANCLSLITENNGARLYSIDL